LYAPYLLLPNHLMAYYWGVPFFFWTGLFSVGFASARELVFHSRQDLRFLRAALICIPVALFTCLTLRYFHTFGEANEQWYIIQQDINRNLLGDLRAVRGRLTGAGTIYVYGADFPFHPWSHTEFLDYDLRFRGNWVLVDKAVSGAKTVSRSARAIPLKEADPSQADLVLIISSQNGTIHKVLDRSALNDLILKWRLDKDALNIVLGDYRVVDALCNGGSNTRMCDTFDVIELAQKMQELHHPELAYDILIMSAKAGSKNPYTYFGLGKAEMSLGRVEEAIANFERAVQLDSQLPNHNFYFVDELDRARRQQSPKR